MTKHTTSGSSTDGSFVHRRQPIEDLDRRWNRNGEGQCTKNDGRHVRHPAGEHVMPPDQEAEQAIAIDE